MHASTRSKKPGLLAAAAVSRPGTQKSHTLPPCGTSTAAWMAASIEVSSARTNRGSTPLKRAGFGMSNTLSPTAGSFADLARVKLSGSASTPLHGGAFATEKGSLGLRVLVVGLAMMVAGLVGTKRERTWATRATGGG